METSTTPTRRSPRTLEKFCKGLTIESLIPEQVVTLLSLCQVTGWSADRIALKLNQVFRIPLLNAEHIYNFHCRWVAARGYRDGCDVGEMEIMKIQLQAIGVQADENARPMHLTIQPTTVNFARRWCPTTITNDAIDEPLCPGFTTIARQYAKTWIASQTNKNIRYSELSPNEIGFIVPFGPTMRKIIESVIKDWGKAMLSKLRDSHPLKPIKSKEHIDLIMKYLFIFQEYYENYFGLMEKYRSAFGHLEDNVVHIHSTGYCAKVMLGLMMADRLYVEEERRREKREAICYEPVDYNDLPEDSKNCPICRDKLGVPNEDGMTEATIRLMICCHQTIGETCLRKWLAEDKSCPCCRFRFPKCFSEKLYSGFQFELVSDYEGSDETMGNELAGPLQEEVRRLGNPQELREPIIRVNFMNATQLNEFEQLESERASHMDGDDDFIMEG